MTVSVMLYLPRSAFVWPVMWNWVFHDHTCFFLLLVKLYTRQTDCKTWCSCSMQKATLLESSQSMELMMGLQNTFLTNVSKKMDMYMSIDFHK